MKGNKEYLNELLEGLPRNSSITMNKYPINGLRLSDPKERFEIIKYMAILKYELLSLDVKYFSG